MKPKIEMVHKCKNFDGKRGCNDAFPSPTLVSTALLVTAATAGAIGVIVANLPSV